MFTGLCRSRCEISNSAGAGGEAELSGLRKAGRLAWGQTLAHTCPPR